MREAGIRADSYLAGLGASGQLILARAWEGLQVHGAAECSASAPGCQKPWGSRFRSSDQPVEVRKPEVHFVHTPQYCHTVTVIL